MNSIKKALVVEDQTSLREAVTDEFISLGWDVVTAENGQEALEKWKLQPTDLIISDIRMPVSDGPKFLDELRKISPNTPPFIFMTGYSDLKTYDAFDRGADAIIGKPLNPDILTDVLHDMTKSDNQKWIQTTPKESNTEITCKTVVGDSSSLQFGRSGFFVATKTFDLSSSLSVNNITTFEIDCPFIADGILKGIGKIVWSRQSDVDGLANGYGIQILTLEESCRSEYIKAAVNFTTCARIPRGALIGVK